MVHLHFHLLPRLVLLALTASAASQLVRFTQSGSNQSQATLEGRGREQQQDGGRMIKLSKRCRYVGTFFRMIDCDAPANSTIVPYRPVALPTATARKRGLKNQRH